MRERSFSERKNTAANLITKYPHSVPVICEPSKSSILDLTTYHNSKYIVPREMKLGAFLLKIRSQLNLTPEVAMFIFVGGGILPPINECMTNLYERYKDPDGFLYLEFSGENVFGV